MAESQEVFYLGSVPVASDDDAVLKAAVQGLYQKLDKIQKKAIDNMVMKKHGTRLSEASPVYKKMMATFKKQGLDCTAGGKVLTSISKDGVSIEDPEKSVTTRLPLNELASYDVLVGKFNYAVLVLVQMGGDRRLILHVLNGDPSKINMLKIKISMLTSGVAPTPIASSGSVLGRAEREEETFSFAEGLQQIQKRRTVNLKGAKSGEVKRRSSTYGNSFGSLGASAPAPPIAPLPDLRHPDQKRAEAERKLSEVEEQDMADNSESYFDEDDLLDGLDEDMFSSMTVTDDQEQSF